jgi:hypothetical protein
MSNAARIAPGLLLTNALWCALVFAAWRAGLLDSFLGSGAIERPLLTMLAALFLIGQGAILFGRYDAADRIAHFLPPAGICCLLLAVTHLGFGADFGTPAGKAAFAKSVIESMGLTCMAVVGLVWLETAIWATEPSDGA